MDYECFSTEFCCIIGWAIVRWFGRNGMHASLRLSLGVVLFRDRRIGERTRGEREKGENSKFIRGREVGDGGRKFFFISVPYHNVGINTKKLTALSEANRIFAGEEEGTVISMVLLLRPLHKSGGSIVNSSCSTQDFFPCVPATQRPCMGDYPPFAFHLRRIISLNGRGCLIYFML